MAPRSTPQVSSRKTPKQARASDLVAAVLDGAVQVLRAEGAARFTTARVAARAGVSVGSLYQYFPNKAAILFRLQADEWRRTSDLLRTILEDSSVPAMERLRALVHAFLRSECDEAEVRTALGDAAPLYRDAPEAAEAQKSGSLVIFGFLKETLLGIDEAKIALAADLVETTLTQVGRSFSETGRTDAEIAAYADAMADMFCAYLTRLFDAATQTDEPPVGLGLPDAGRGDKDAGQARAGIGRFGNRQDCIPVASGRGPDRG